MPQINQCGFEIVRDVATLIKRLKPGEDVLITISRQENGQYFDWQSTNGTPCGWSETAVAMEKAYYKFNKFHAPKEQG